MACGVRDGQCVVCGCVEVKDGCMCGCVEVKEGACVGVRSGLG